jgi:predicted GIY-YIG superfamily endonuclease
METISIGTIHIYIMKLEHGCWFVGSTNDIPKSVKHHFMHATSEWMKLHKPIAMEASYRYLSRFDEDRYTKEYMLKYGIDKVRGGTYALPNIDDEQKRMIQRELWGIQNLCTRCGKLHINTECPDEVGDDATFISYKKKKTTCKDVLRELGYCIYGYITDILLIPPQTQP